MNITQEAREGAKSIAEKIVSDVTRRWVCLKPLYDSEDLATSLISQAIAAAEARGFERAQEMVEGHLRNYYEDGLADEIAAMKDDQS